MNISEKKQPTNSHSRSSGVQQFCVLYEPMKCSVRRTDTHQHLIFSTVFSFRLVRRRNIFNFTHILSGCFDLFLHVCFIGQPSYEMRNDLIAVSAHIFFSLLHSVRFNCATHYFRWSARWVSEINRLSIDRRTSLMKIHWPVYHLGFCSEIKTDGKKIFRETKKKKTDADNVWCWFIA